MKQELKIRINVTKKDINLGRRSVPHNCPIALAIKRKMPNEKWVSVIGSGVHFLNNNMGLKYASLPLPSKAEQFIENFDKGEKVKPFSFELDFS